MPNELIELQTPRLTLRRWHEAYRAPFAALNQDPRVMEHFPALIPRERSDASIDAWMGDFAAQGWGNWAVERRDTGEFIGFSGLSDVQFHFEHAGVPLGHPVRPHCLYRLTAAQWRANSAAAPT